MWAVYSPCARAAENVRALRQGNVAEMYVWSAALADAQVRGIDLSRAQGDERTEDT
jgi:hypothetical protein